MDNIVGGSFPTHLLINDNSDYNVLEEEIPLFTTEKHEDAESSLQNSSSYYRLLSLLGTTIKLLERSCLLLAIQRAGDLYNRQKSLRKGQSIVIAVVVKS